MRICESLKALVCVGFIALMSTVSIAQTVPLPSNASRIQEAAALVAAAADAVTKVAEGIKAFVVTGYQGYSFVAAQRQHERLKEISAQATYLVNAKQGLVVQSIDEYLLKTNPNLEDWWMVTSRIDEAMYGVSTLLEDVRKERSDLVLEDAYAKLVSSLHSRSIMLNRLSTLPAPISADERKALTEFNVEYKRLLDGFRSTIRELNTYIKSEKKT